MVNIMRGGAWKYVTLACSDGARGTFNRMGGWFPEQAYLEGPWDQFSGAQGVCWPNADKKNMYL